MITKFVALVAIMAAVQSIAVAANPADFIPAVIREHVNVSPQEIQEKAIGQIAQGNLTKEQIGKEINATRKALREQFTEHVNESLNITPAELGKEINATKKVLIEQVAEHLNESPNITPEQLQQKAKEELQRQAAQRAQQPGFEAILALAGILGITFFLRRKS